MNKIRCHYCEEEREVEQCPHCKKYYCSEHINPIEPGSYHPEKSRVFVNQMRLGHEKTHPCPDYVDYLEQQKKIQGRKWSNTLDRLTGRTHKGEEIEYNEDTIYQDNVSTEYKKQQRIDEKARLKIEKEKLSQQILEK